MNTRSIWKGFFSAIALNILFAAIYFVILTQISPRFVQNPANSPIFKDIQNIFVYLFWGIGFSQALYILPIALWLRQQRQFEFMRGLLIGAFLTALFCGSCFIVVFPSFSNYFILR